MVESIFNLEKLKIQELLLAPIGGEFRQRVWKILCTIPYGEVYTYGDIAKKIVKDTGKRSMSVKQLVEQLVIIPYLSLFPAIESWEQMEI